MSRFKSLRKAFNYLLGLAKKSLETTGVKALALIKHPIDAR